MSLAKRLALQLPVNLAQAVAGFGAVAAFTRLLSAEDYGRYALILSGSMLAHAAALTWVEAAAYRFLPSNNDKRDVSAHFATLLVLVIGAATLAGLLACAALAFLGLGEAVAPAVALAAVATATRFLTRLAREGERAAGETGRYAARESVFVILGFGLGAALAATTRLGPAAPFAGAAIAGVLVGVPDFVRLIGRAKGGAPDGARARAYAAYGAPLALAVALDIGLQTGLRGVLATAGPAAVGAFAAAFGVAWRALDLLFAWSGLAGAPLLLAAHRAGDAAEVTRTSRRLFITLLALAAPGTAGLVLIASPLCALMVGPDLATEAAACAPWLAVAALFSGFATHYWSEAFQLACKTLRRAALMALAAATALALAAALTPRFGAEGAAMAAAGGAFVAAVLLAMFGRALVPLAFPLGDVARIGAATALMIASLTALATPQDWTGLLAFAMVGAAVYGLAAIALNVGGLRRTLWALASTQIRQRRASCYGTGHEPSLPPL